MCEYAYSIAVALRNLHLCNLYHCDLHWGNIMIDTGNDLIYFIDLQFMKHCHNGENSNNNSNNNSNSTNNNNAWKWFSKDLVYLYYLFGIETTSETKKEWKKKFDRNEIKSVYDETVFPFFKNLTRNPPKSFAPIIRNHASFSYSM